MALFLFTFISDMHVTENKNGNFNIFKKLPRIFDEKALLTNGVRQTIKSEM